MKTIFLLAFSLFSVLAIHAQMVATNTTSDPNTCDGSAGINSANLVSWYWTDGLGNQIQNGGDSLNYLCTGNYTLFYDDGSGMLSENFTIGVNPCYSLSLTFSSTNDLNGTCVGTASANVVGGTAPYTYVWFINGQNANNPNTSISNLCQGYVSANVTDANGCYTSGWIQIVNDPCTFTVTPTIVGVSSPNVCDASIDLSITNGTGPYTCNWLNGTTSTTISNLCSGFYTALITDGLGCSDSVGYSISDPCSGFFTYLSGQATSSPVACDGLITSAVYGGTQPYTYLWSNGETTANPMNLCVGYYTVYVTDANGCTFQTSLTINDTLYNGNPCANIGTSYTINNASDANTCDGFLALTGIGNTYLVDYLWSNGATTPSIDNLCPGFYAVTAIDSNGCSVNTSFYVLVDSVLNTPLNGSVYTEDESSIGSCDGNAQVVLFGGLAPFQYFHSSGATGQNVYNLCPGQYSVLVVDANNDSISIDYLISSDTLNLVYNPYLDSINVNTLYTDLVQLCSIDITTIDTAFVNYFYSNHPDSLTIIWSIHTASGWQDMAADYFIGNSPNGVYTVVLGIYCPVKSIGQQMKIISEIYLDRAALQLDQNQLLIANAYPNPFNQSVSVELPDNQPYDLVLYNGLGQIVRTLHVSGESTTVTFDDLSGLNKGSYVLMIQGEKAVQPIKLIK